MNAGNAAAVRREPISPERIELYDAEDAVYWTETLNVAFDELNAAVTAVGPLSADVRRYLAALTPSA